VDVFPKAVERHCDALLIQRRGSRKHLVGSGSCNKAGGETSS
jgi:hypothetical protein